jgi:tRNA threonylcarbamoyl adenosine modification protein YeaZ
VTGRERWLLVVDTATSTAVVAAGTPAGEVLAAESFAAEHRHSQALLPAIERLRTRARVSLGDIGGVIVGTGPGAFTGLRVGLATAKTLAHELGVPIVGVATGEALLAASGSGTARLWLPAGPHDRVLVIAGRPPRLVRGPDPVAGRGGDDGAGIAVDLEGRAPADALERGRRAVEGLAAALLRLGAMRLREGRLDDAERLVPEYVTLPRGVAGRLDLEGGVAWSHDPR